MRTCEHKVSRAILCKLLGEVAISLFPYSCGQKLIISVFSISLVYLFGRCVSLTSVRNGVGYVVLGATLSSGVILFV